MSKCNDESVSERDWTVKKLVKTYHYYFLKVNSDKKVSIIDSYNLECIEGELKRRGYKIVERLPIIRRPVNKQNVV
jgi:hypothetical protein